MGNFIGDFVKGNQYDNYPAEIRRGILLHRQIDSYTDSHPVVRETVAMLRPHFGRYSAIVVDLYFDHILALRFEDYSENRSLKRLSMQFYAASIIYYGHLPSRVKGFIWHFISTHRLRKYATIEGLKESLQIMQRHKTPAIDPDLVIDYLKQNSNQMESQFRLFFPDLIKFVNEYEHPLV